MPINKVQNTPIVNKAYNARGLTVNHAVTKSCIRQSDGTLWVVIGDYSNKMQILRSSNNGFSWSIVHDGVESGNDMREQTGFNTDGLFAYLVIDERWRNVDLYMGEYESTGGDGSLERSRYDLDDDDATETNTTILSTTDDPFQGGSFDVSYNNEQTFISWVDSSGDLLVTRCSPRTTSVSSDLSASVSGHYGFISSCCDENGKVHIASTWLDGSDRKLSYYRYDSTTPSFDGTLVLENLGTTPAIAKDVCIARDGTNTICVFYYDQGDDELRYVMSYDGGTNWDTPPTTLSRTAGHGTYNDLITGDAAGRCNIIAGSKGGFLISYVEDDAGGLPRTYVRQLTADDSSGTSYTLQAEQEIATAERYATEPVIGLQFFHPPGEKLLDLSDPGLVRVAFTVGQGDSLIMADTNPLTFGQELLRESAYPSSLDSEDTDDAYSIDTESPPSTTLSYFSILGGPDSLIDYYTAGITGKFTDRYIAAFNRIGTTLRLLRFDPDVDNYMNDRSAFGAPTELQTLALFDPVTYSFPSPALNRSTTIERVEQDIRKLHIPPTMFLSREFVVNQGGHLKRTVWLCEYDGNQYEISQVIPRFISNQICYYECNAYVVGPSRDPFSRTVLPSET